MPNRYAFTAGLDLDDVRTVVLNPSAVDTAGPQLETAKDEAAVPFTLQIRFAAQAGDGGIPVAAGGAELPAGLRELLMNLEHQRPSETPHPQIGGDAPLDMAQAAKVKQARAGSRVLPLADMIISG